MALTRTQKIGIVVILSSLVIGIGGTVWNVYGSFWSLAEAENAGIRAIGDSLRNALIFTAGGLVGTIVGALILIFGRSKS